MDDLPIDAGGLPGGPVIEGGAPPVAPPNGSAPAWHESLLTKGADGTESLADPATWLDKVPKPLGEFVRSQMTAARQKTEGMIKVPIEGSPPEEWEAFYKGVGRPEKPEDYKFEKPEKMPDGVSWDDEATKRFAPAAHEAGLTPAQVAILSKWQIGEVAAQAAATRENVAKLVAEEQETLKKQYPGEHGLTDAAAIGQSVVNKYGIASAAMDPSSGEFWGPEPMKVIIAQAREIAKLKGEATVTGHTSTSQVKGGYEWAGDVMNNPKNPDYQRYRDGKDPAFQKEVNAAFATSPKDWMPAKVS